MPSSRPILGARSFISPNHECVLVPRRQTLKSALFRAKPGSGLIWTQHSLWNVKDYVCVCHTSTGPGLSQECHWINITTSWMCTVGLHRGWRRNSIWSVSRGPDGDFVVRLLLSSATGHIYSRQGLVRFNGKKPIGYIPFNDFIVISVVWKLEV